MRDLKRARMRYKENYSWSFRLQAELFSKIKCAKVDKDLEKHVHSRGDGTSRKSKKSKIAKPTTHA